MSRVSSSYICDAVVAGRVKEDLLGSITDSVAHLAFIFVVEFTMGGINLIAP